MSDAIKAEVAGTSPIILELEPGDYFWCKCGRSANQPFCDGAHSGTPFQPIKYTLEKAKKVAFCSCKRTANEPLCDGNHRFLEKS